MANSRQAAKRARQDVVRRANNVVHRTRFRTYQKKVVNAVAANDAKAAREALGEFVSVADAVAGRNIVHPNKAARIKRRLHAAVRSLSAGTQS